MSHLGVCLPPACGGGSAAARRVTHGMNTHASLCFPLIADQIISTTLPMAQASSSSTSTATSNFQPIFEAALKAYEKKTKKDLLAHPLATHLKACKCAGDILNILQDRAKEFEGADERLSRWLSPTITVLYAFSAALKGVGLLFSPAIVISAGIDVLFSAAKDVEASQEALFDLFGRIEFFFKRLESYTTVRPTDAMTDIIVMIMVEVLDIFAIATKEMKQSKAKKYLRKLVGRNGIADALKRLDRLTREEALMAATENLKLTQFVYDVVNTVRNDGIETHHVIQNLASSVDDIIWSQTRKSLREWALPPDPSSNHNVACDLRHGGTTRWFFRGSMFAEWKLTGSLLWIYGKPGSGKTILCSSIVQDIVALSEAGSASMAYFYFDFRDLEKQHIRNLLPSLLIQLSAQSDSRRNILSRLYLAHDNGEKKPRVAVMTQCLADMLTVSDPRPTYIILDALDECPNSSGIPSPREQVLALVKELVNLHLPHLHICVTSRPEFDIRATLRPLALHSVSLHDESGQKKDIVDYVNSVVYSDSETMMKKWREDDKKMVVDSLSEKADGMFRWVFCQLETLRYCLPQSVLRTLNELPESLDETYERVVMEIKRANQVHAYRMLQCLAAAIRPLSVAELAELLAFDFDVAKGGIPKLNAGWRWEDHEEAVLSTCSSLITVIPGHGSAVVQFSHFSVKEFLMSERLAASTREISQYHIALEDAHTALAQASLGVLLRDSDLTNNADGGGPLARYAAEHWVTHAQVKNVASRVRNGMKRLFDPNKPYFSAWVQIHDADRYTLGQGTASREPGARQVYYAALCGFLEVVDYLALNYPRCAGTCGGRCGTALHAASFAGHLQIVPSLLLRHGVSVNVRDYAGDGPLRFASQSGHCDVVRYLIDHGADVNLKGEGQNTPLNWAAHGGHVDVVRVLLGHKADVRTVDHHGRTPLHDAIWGDDPRGDYPRVVRLLLEHGADVNARDIQHRTPLHLVPMRPTKLDVLRILLEHGAEADAEDEKGRTPLQVLMHGQGEIARLLSEFRALRAQT